MAEQLSVVDKKRALLVNRSTTTRIAVFGVPLVLLEIGSWVMRSVVIISQGPPGTSLGCSKPYGA